VDGNTPESPSTLRSLAIVCGAAGIGIALFAIVPRALDIRLSDGDRYRGADEANSVGSLKALITAQSLFREGDKDGDGNFDYGSLAELSDAQLVDAALGSGTQWGYVFQVDPAPETAEFLWMAVANPTADTDGARSFCVNHEGLVFYTVHGPLTLNPACEIPPDCMPMCSACDDGRNPEAGRCLH
jgi:hypothetical protein